MRTLGFTLAVITLLFLPQARAARVLVEAESFAEHGGWKLDTQFIHEMGSPYLLAHGLGTPVEDAVGTVAIPEAGSYHIFVRTKDWVARWDASESPGQFRVSVNGQLLQETFGTKTADWDWQYGGMVEFGAGDAEIAIKDLTGFDGRVDALYFTTDRDDLPPSEGEILPAWRRDLLGLPETPEVKSGYDLVVVGGGYAGMAAAISAGRMGCKVALIQNRPVLGGNGSSEVRVWSQGNIRRGKFPRIGEIVQEFADNASSSPGFEYEFGDELKEQVIRGEKNIDLFLNHHAYEVAIDDGTIAAVYTLDTRSSALTRFEGTLFADCTGHGTIGALAGADWEMEEDGRMGMSNMWRWAEDTERRDFPRTEWALDLEMDGFPYPRDFHGEWFWESGFDLDPLNDAEGIRDWNLRAVFGAFNAMKNKGEAEQHSGAYLTWVAYIGGPRESRRLMGDVVLTQDHIIEKHEFPDGCVPSTWSIDLHYPKDTYIGEFDENPFISYAVHDRRVDRQYGYPVPYRCFYSRNIPNLFMAGRNISVTHEALGTVRVMRTCGMMGEVVGKAAALCIEHETSPRGIYESHLDGLLALLELPGKAYRESLGGETIIPEDALKKAGPLGPMSGLDPATLSGSVVDDLDADRSGDWSTSENLKGYVAHGYSYAGAGSGATAAYNFTLSAAGDYEVRVAHQPHENRATNATVIVHTASGDVPVTLNMRQAPTAPKGFSSLGVFPFAAGSIKAVTITTQGADGTVHADAVQLIPQR